MKKFRTVIAVIVMLIASFLGLFAGAFLGTPGDGMIWGALIAGFACVVYTIDNSGRNDL